VHALVWHVQANLSIFRICCGTVETCSLPAFHWMEGRNMANDDGPPGTDRVTREKESASDEFPGGAIAHAWREEFDEDLTWGDMARWLGESG
jgi:hypothetical protein